MSDLALGSVVDAIFLAAAADVGHPGGGVATDPAAAYLPLADPFSALIGQMVEELGEAEDRWAGQSDGAKDVVAMPANNATAVPADTLPPFAALARGAAIADGRLAAALAGAAMGITGGAPAAGQVRLGSAGPDSKLTGTLRAGIALGAGVVLPLASGMAGTAPKGSEPDATRPEPLGANAGGRSDANAGADGTAASLPSPRFVAAGAVPVAAAAAKNLRKQDGLVLRASDADTTVMGRPSVPTVLLTPTPPSAAGRFAQEAETTSGLLVGHAAPAAVGSPVTVREDGGERNRTGERALDASPPPTSGASAPDGATKAPLQAASRGRSTTGMTGASGASQTEPALRRLRGTPRSVADGGGPASADRLQGASARPAPPLPATPGALRADGMSEHASDRSRQPDRHSNGARSSLNFLGGGARVGGRDAAPTEHRARIITGADDPARSTATAAGGAPADARSTAVQLQALDQSPERSQRPRREGNPRNLSGPGTNEGERPSKHAFPLQAVADDAGRSVYGVKRESGAQTVAAPASRPFGGDAGRDGGAGRDPGARDGKAIVANAGSNAGSSKRGAGAPPLPVGLESSVLGSALIIPALIVQAPIVPVQVNQARIIQAGSGEPAMSLHGLEDHHRFAAAYDENAIASETAFDWINLAAWSSRVGRTGVLIRQVAAAEAAGLSVAADTPAFGGLQPAAVLRLAAESSPHPSPEIDTMEARSPSPYEAQGPPRRAPPSLLPCLQLALAARTSTIATVTLPVESLW